MFARLIAQEGPLKGLIISLAEGEEWILGRDPDQADFVLEDGTVSRKHARITQTQEGFFIKNLSRVNRISVNDEIKKEASLLKEGDLLRIGSTLFLFTLKEETPSLSQEPEGKGPSYDDIFGDVPHDISPPVTTEFSLDSDDISSEEDEESSHEKTVYDTIFEDVEENPNFSLHTPDESPFLLKVIAGPNTGAEIGLEKGRSYLIGKNPQECDIVFQDLSVSKRHAELSISEDRELSITDLNSKNGTMVNGMKIEHAHSLSPQDIVSLGTSFFLVIDCDAPQDTIFSPSFTHISDTHLTQAQAEEISPVKVDWKKEKIPPKYLIAASSCAAIFLIAFLSFFSLFKSHPIEIAQGDPREEIQEALLPFSGVEFFFNPASGKLFITGHVSTAVEASELTYSIEPIEAIQILENQVIIDEYVCKSMNELLGSDSQWEGAVVVSPSPGEFLLQGYLNTEAIASQLWDMMLLQFPYTDRLQNHLIVEEDLKLEISSLLIRHGLGGVSFDLSNGKVVLSGFYSEKKQTPFHDFLQTLKKTKGVLQIQNFATATLPHLAAIDLSSDFQVSGISLFDGKGFSAILNGKIYTLGDSVEGMRITEILENTILLEKEGLKYKINYSQ